MPYIPRDQSIFLNADDAKIWDSVLTNFSDNPRNPDDELVAIRDIYVVQGYPTLCYFFYSVDNERDYVPSYLQNLFEFYTRNPHRFIDVVNFIIRRRRSLEESYFNS